MKFSASTLRVEINQAINKRLKEKLAGIRVENFAETNQPQQSNTLTFFFDSSVSSEPEDINLGESFTQRQTLYYRCNIRSATATGDDKNAAIVDMVNHALMGFQILPQRMDDEGFVFLVSDESVELQNGLLYHSVIVGVNHYLSVYPDQ